MHTFDFINLNTVYRYGVLLNVMILCLFHNSPGHQKKSNVNFMQQFALFKNILLYFLPVIRLSICASTLILSLDVEVEAFCFHNDLFVSVFTTDRHMDTLGCDVLNFGSSTSFTGLIYEALTHNVCLYLNWALPGSPSHGLVYML